MLTVNLFFFIYIFMSRRILNKIISRCKKGEECSKRIIRYIHGTSPITFNDTPGISTEKIMDTMIELIEKKKY